MKTLEQLKQEQAKEVKALEAQLAAAQLFANAGLPIPDYIGDSVHGAITAHYRNPAPLRGLSEALDLFRGFPCVVPFAVMRAGCCTMLPESRMPEKMKAQGYKRDIARNSADYAAALRVSHISNSQTRAELSFFAELGGVLFSVSVDFGRDYIGNCSKLAPKIVENRDGRTNRLNSRTFAANNVAQSMADSVIAFASGDMGPVKESSDHRYLFVADHAEESAPGSDFEHACGMLQNLADNLGV